MHIAITPTPEDASKLAAKIIIPQVKPGFRLGVATGSTPEGLYAELRAAHEQGQFSLEECTAWALDEYVGIAPDHPERYRNVLRRELVGSEKTGLKDENLHTPDGTASDPHQAARDYEAEIAPGVDLQILGIGADGHIGFNEPTGSLSNPTNVVTLTAQTIADNARFFDNDEANVPKQAVTQGLSTIMKSGQAVLLAFGSQKADAVAATVEGAVSAFWPASILQYHLNAFIIADEAAASKLQLTDYYRQTWQAEYPDLPLSY